MYRPSTISFNSTETEPYSRLRLFFSCMKKMLEAINAVNHAPVMNNTIIDESITENMEIISTIMAYKTACDFMVKKSSLVILKALFIFSASFSYTHDNIINFDIINNIIFILCRSFCAYKSVKTHIGLA